MREVRYFNHPDAFENTPTADAPSRVARLDRVRPQPLKTEIYHR